jgi:hypothetical protein
MPLSQNLNTAGVLYNVIEEDRKKVTLYRELRYIESKKKVFLLEEPKIFTLNGELRYID